MALKRMIENFGGQVELARLLGVAQSTIAYWVKVGRVPAKWHQKIIDLANKKGVSVQLHELSGISYEQTENTLIHVSEASEYMVKEGSESFLFYASEDSTISVQVLLGEETVWASQKGMAEIFDIESHTINYHLKNIFQTNELDENTVTRENRVTASDGKMYETSFYNLDVIIAVGYRVNSYRATKFRKWATSILREYLIKGFALDDERMKQGNNLFNKDYFEELLERMFYQKVT